MLFDKDYIKKFYKQYQQNIEAIRQKLDKPLTLSEKLLFAHVSDHDNIPERGKDYACFHPDRVAMQDATAQMALMQFINAGRNRTAVPTTVHCDHLIQAAQGAGPDLQYALKQNNEVYQFLRSVSKKYGIGFWEPGSGIIHQVVLENYAFPGGMLIGTDSHTVNAGGLGMMAIGVGGADAVDVMAGMPWELKMPKLIGVHLTGKLSGWTSPKDVILKLAGILTVKGGTNSIVEYFGPGADSISATGKGTICNMGAEIGATTSIFPYDDNMYSYLSKTGRKEVADLAAQIRSELRQDDEVNESPEKFYDQIIEIDLSKLEPHINGPYSPDAAVPISEFAEKVRKNHYPETLDAALVGSCTNSSYEDLTRAASIADQALKHNITARTELMITPGSEQIKKTGERDGLLQKFEKISGTIMANACGPCIGQWRRQMDDPDRKNSILNSYNRNFAKRNDGNPNTHSFVASPEIVTAMSLSGKLTFNPLKDELVDGEGNRFVLDEPRGIELPEKGYLQDDSGYVPPVEDGHQVDVEVKSDSERLQLLEPFDPWDGNDLLNLQLLIKVKGKCTTDHISMAGHWLRFRGHLDNISDNLLMGAENSFNGKTNSAYDKLSQTYDKVSAVGGKKKIEWFQIHAGLSALKNYGDDLILPEDTIKAIREYKVAVKGPLTTPVGKFDYVCLDCTKEQDGVDGRRPEKCIKCGSKYMVPRFRSLNVGLRQILDLYACVRPVRWYKGVPCPVKHPEKLDVIVFRENTEDVYSGIEYQEGSQEAGKVIQFLQDEMKEEVRLDSGIGIKPISITGTKRLVRKAINYAIERNKQSVTLVHKGNIMKFTEGAFRDWGYDLAKEEFRDQIVTEHELWDELEGKMPKDKILIKDRIADQMFQQVLLRPDEYSVIATPNLNGDYLSDATAAQVGGLGLAPGANIGDQVALFEATHGTAPKYTGMDKVNPSSLILSGVMMLRHLGWDEAADLIEEALEKTVSNKTVTYDLERQMSGAVKLKTSEFGEKIIENMGN